MLVHVQGGRFAGGADRNHAVDARGDLLLEQMGDGGLVDAALAKEEGMRKLVLACAFAVSNPRFSRS
jgi:hypothetical protein